MTDNTVWLSRHNGKEFYRKMPEIGLALYVNYITPHGWKWSVYKKKQMGKLTVYTFFRSGEDFFQDMMEAMQAVTGWMDDNKNKTLARTDGVVPA